MNTLSAAFASSFPTEVEFSATVLCEPRYFTGTLSHARHEAFDCQTDGGQTVEIVDNVDLAPPVSVRPGDRISVRGEFVRDAARGPLVHWTHHDPAAHHADGWIDFAGRRYA